MFPFAAEGSMILARVRADVLTWEWKDSSELKKLSCGKSEARDQRCAILTAKYWKRVHFLRISSPPDVSRMPLTISEFSSSCETCIFYYHYTENKNIKRVCKNLHLSSARCNKFFSREYNKLNRRRNVKLAMKTLCLSKHLLLEN